MTGSPAGLRRPPVARLRRARRRLRRWLGPPVRNGSLSLLYHRAAQETVDPWRLAVTPSHLSEHLEILARHTRPTTAAALRSRLARGRVAPRTVLVTFDDGYADLATEIAPRLRSAGVPATVFVVSRAVDRDREFWWDALARALLGPERGAGPLTLPIGDARRSWDLVGDDPTAIHRAVWAELRRRPPEERDDLVEQVLAWAGLSAGARSSHRTLTSEELAALAADDLVEIGSHTANHPWLSGLPPSRQRGEIDSGRSELEDYLDRPVTSFAYPHGGPDDVPAAAQERVRSIGFETAFLASPGRITARRDPLRLPRLFVDDMDGDGFAALLWRYAGIKVG